MARVLSAFKNTLVPAGLREMKVPFGLIKGMTVSIDLRKNLQAVLGLEERELFAAFQRLGKGIKTSVDVGAARGFYSLFFLAKCNVTKHFAFEPDPLCREALTQNLALNGFSRDSRVHLDSRFVSNTECANSCRLDSFADEIHGPCLIKIDVEGGEVDVLAGAESLLKRKDASWVIETHSLELEKNCIEIMEKYGYRVKIVSNAWWRVFIPELRVIPHNRWLIATR